MLGRRRCAKGAARLAEIEAAQKAVFERYSADIRKIEQTEKAQAAVVERFRADLQKNVDAALALARLSHRSGCVRGSQIRHHAQLRGPGRRKCSARCG